MGSRIDQHLTARPDQVAAYLGDVQKYFVVRNLGLENGLFRPGQARRYRCETDLDVRICAMRAEWYQLGQHELRPDRQARHHIAVHRIRIHFVVPVRVPCARPDQSIDCSVTPDLSACDND